MGSFINRSVMNRRAAELWLGVMIDRYSELVNEKQTTIFPNTRQGIDEFNLLCNHINYYYTRAIELSKELGIRNS